MLEAIDISYNVGNKTILKDVNLRIEGAQVVGLVGPSAAGKTTLAKIVAGHIGKYTGEVKMDGQDIRGLEGFCPVQLLAQHPQQALDPMLVVGKSLNMAGIVDEQLMDDLLIDPAWLLRYPPQLSAGQLQRICIARIFTGDLKYIIADEICAMLDTVTQKQILEVMLNKVKDDNLGMLFISHDKDLVAKVADKIVSMDDINAAAYR